MRKRIGYVFGGDRGLYERLSAQDNLRYFAELYGVSGKAQRLRIDEVLELVGLKGREQERVEGYSRGMRQRLHIARGILHDPEVVFLDEPTIGVDPVGARELRTTISGLIDSGKTVLLTTHYMFEADALCDRIAVIAKGRIVGAGTPAELKAGVAEGHVTEIEVFGVDDATVDRLRALDGVKAVTVEEPRPEAGARRAGERRARADAAAARGARRRRGRARVLARADPRGRLRRTRRRARRRMKRVPDHPQRVHDEPEDARDVELLPAHVDRAADHLRDVAFYMFQSGGRPGTLLYAALGAGMMGVWSTTLFGSGGMIQWQRWQGTLELGVGAPPSMTLVYLPFSLANAFTGMYALVATLVWGRIVFGIPLHLVHPWQFALALPATVISLGLMGLVLASTFVLYRYANALSNLLEYPVWIASGPPLLDAILPAWTRPISWVLPPYWGILAHPARRARRRRLVPARDGAPARARRARRSASSRSAGSRPPPAPARPSR